MELEKAERLLVLLDNTAVAFGAAVAVVAYGLCFASHDMQSIEGLVSLAVANQSNLPFMRALANAQVGHTIAAVEVARYELSLNREWHEFTGDVMI